MAMSFAVMQLVMLLVSLCFCHSMIIILPCYPQRRCSICSSLIMLDIHPHDPRDINGPQLSDGHTSGIQPQTLRESLGMREFRLFTTSQLMIYQDHKSESRSYDGVSMFGMRPPELVGVFQQTKSYIRLCYVEHGKITSDADHAILRR